MIGRGLALLLPGAFARFRRIASTPEAEGTETYHAISAVDGSKATSSDAGEHATFAH